jgi:hypothetical protein
MKGWMICAVAAIACMVSPDIDDMAGIAFAAVGLVAFFVQPEPVEGGLSVVGQSARGFGCIAQIVAIAIVVGIASHAAGVLDDIVREVAK